MSSPALSLSPVSDTNSATLRTGGEILLDQLILHGTRMMYCVPGESYLAVLDALVDRPSLNCITCRHESGAGFMAEAYGKLTGQPGIAFVTRGPGATNASIAVHCAKQDSTPMILFIGQVASNQVDREAFQEIDYRAMFGNVAKWVAQIDDAARIPEYIARAFTVATSGRPGPVVIALPEDMLTSTTQALDARPFTSLHQNIDQNALDKMAHLLSAATKPLVVLGGGVWDDNAVAAITRFAENWSLPISVSFRRQDCFDNHHPLYIGDFGYTQNAKMVARFHEADVILLLGTRFSEAASQGYSLLESPVPRQKLIHIHADVAELGRVYQADLGIAASIPAMAHALAGLAPTQPVTWQAWTESARQDYVGWSSPHPTGRALDLAICYDILRKTLPPDSITTNDAGNFSGWGQRYYQWSRPGRQLGPTCGSMGYAVPAAVGAKLAFPERTVLCQVGDGGFMMTGNELATAVQYGPYAKGGPIFLVFDNGMYGTIRMHQEKHYPARVSQTSLHNPDFAALATSFGAVGVRVETTEQFLPALEAALLEQRPTLIHLVCDPEQMTTGASLNQIRSAAEQALAKQKAHP